MHDDLYESFDCSVKLGSVFTAIRGIDLPIDEFDLPIRIYNSLHRGGIPEWGKGRLQGVASQNKNYSLYRFPNIIDLSKFNKEAIFMKELNQKLSECYKDILGETAITAPFGEDGLSMPFLIKFADETAVETADLRVMFFGQETREWTDIGTVDDVMEIYCKNFNDFSDLPGSGTFWRILLEMKGKVNERLPSKRISFIWNNIIKADYSPSTDYNGYKVPNEIYAKFRDVNRQLILSEIEIIKPDVIVFFTGSTLYYDEKIDYVFNNGTKSDVEKDHIIIDDNKNILAVAHLPEIFGRKYDAYISYHPRGLDKNPKAKDFVLDTIVKQCEKAVTDRNKRLRREWGGR